MSYLKNTYHFFLAWLGALIYRNPSRKLVVIGITGTKGKTTTTELVRAILVKAGYKVAMLSSANISYGEEVVPRTGNTMPGRFFLQRFMRRALDAGCTHVVFEVTSQGVVQHRHRFIDFDVAALTNLHPEHIEAHGSYEAYREAKVSFFRAVARFSSKPHKHFFINVGTGGDGEYFENAVLHPTGKGHFGEIVFYSRENFLRNNLGNDRSRVSEWLRSDFNLENAALAYAIAQSLKIPKEAILRALHDFRGVAGRLEFFRAAGKTAIVDYALTPDSLRALYSYVRTLLPAGGRIIAVFGSAAGGRDTWKRPELGRVAGQLCDAIYLTADDSYDEDPAVIIEEIRKGVMAGKPCFVIVDRAQAIKAAIDEATSRDIVVVTGMGSQTHAYGPKGSKLSWSDARAVTEALNGRILKI